MQTQTETQTLPMFNDKLSLYIPRIVPHWACQEAVKNKFESLYIGNVERVDFVYCENEGTIYYQGFVHFTSWFEGDMTRNLQEKINNPEKVAKLVYDDPWYWILLPNKNPRTENEVRLEKHMKDIEASIEWNNSQSQEYVMMLESRISSLENEVRALAAAAGRPPYVGAMPPIPPMETTDMEIDTDLSGLTAAMASLSIADTENAEIEDIGSRRRTFRPISTPPSVNEDTPPPPPPPLRRSTATQSANERLLSAADRISDEEIETIRRDLRDDFQNHDGGSLLLNTMPDLWRDACITAGYNPITQSPIATRAGFNSPTPH